MLPSVIKNLSKTRTRNAFPEIPIYNDKQIWEKAQKLVSYIYKDEDLFIFTSQKFVDLQLKAITPRLISKYCDAYRKSKTWREFQNSKIFYIYSQESNMCDCHDYWKKAYCKHYLATMIYLKKIKVYSKFY